MSSADQPHAIQHAGPRASTWLNPSQAATYVGVSIADFLPLVESGQLTLHRAPDQSLRINRDDLDAVLQPVPPDEAVRLLMAEGPPSTLLMPTTHIIPAAQPSDDTRPLKEAAVTLDMPYKTLLRLASEGAIPAIDLNAHRGRLRPRFVVSISALRIHLKNLGDKQAAMRRARQPGIDLARLAQPQGGGR